MTSEQFVKTIASDLKDEMNGVLHYLNLHNEAKKMNWHCECQVLKDMAKEECTHAKMLIDIIHKNKGTMTISEAERKEMQEQWAEVEEAIKGI